MFLFIEFGIALIQHGTGIDRNVNVDHAISKIREAVAKYNPRLVCLPECFNSPYGVDQFDKYAEFIPEGYTSQKLGAIAKELNIYLLGGTIPERDEIDRKTMYNTAIVFGPDGKLIAKHRKVRLGVKWADHFINFCFL